MSRKSTAAKAVAPVVTLPKKIPEPPKHLTADQGQIWRLVMAAPAGDMVTPDSYPVLAEYCRLVVQSNQVAAELDEFDPDWATDDEGLRRWETLLKMHDRIVGRIVSVATKLRITPQTRTQQATAGTISRKGGGRKPWQFENDD